MSDEYDTAAMSEDAETARNAWATAHVRQALDPSPTNERAEGEAWDAYLNSYNTWLFSLWRDHAEMLSNALFNHCACPTHGAENRKQRPCDAHRAHDALMAAWLPPLRAVKP